MASSTTMPIASTRPKSERLLRQKPNAGHGREGADERTGTAISGMSAARQFCRNTSTTRATRMTASKSVLDTSLIDSRMNGVGVVDDGVVEALRETLLQLVHLGADRVGRVEGVGAGQLVRSPSAAAGLPSSVLVTVVVARRQLDAARRRCTRMTRPSAPVLTMMSANCSVDREPAERADRCTESGRARRAPAAGRSARGDLHVLLLDGRDHVLRPSGCASASLSGSSQIRML